LAGFSAPAPAEAAREGSVGDRPEREAREGSVGDRPEREKNEKNENKLISTNYPYPKLRPIDIQSTVQRGQPALLLRDPLQLSGNYVVLPETLGPALAMLDGALALNDIRLGAMVSYGLVYPDELLQYLIEVLDENFMLENARAAAAHERDLTAYRTAPFRLPAMAGLSYPADPAELRRLFDGYLRQVNGAGGAVLNGAGRGVFSPHIDYHRGGPVYAAVWQQAAAMAQAAELVILLGTDHYSMDDRLTLTRQSYATPYGVLPTDTATVDALTDALGQEVLSGELRHLGEHSIELVAIWLHHMRGGEPVPVVPILTGSFAEYMSEGVSPLTDGRLKRLVETLKAQTAGRRVLVVSSGDLSHVGPAFEGEPLNANDKRLLQADDAQVVDLLCDGDDEGFYNALQRTRNSTNICGLSPTYLAMKVMGAVEGERVAYDVCPADGAETSVVTIAGLVFESI